MKATKFDLIFHNGIKGQKCRICYVGQFDINQKKNLPGINKNVTNQKELQVYRENKRLVLINIVNQFSLPKHFYVISLWITGNGGRGRTH